MADEVAPTLEELRRRREEKDAAAKAEEEAREIANLLALEKWEAENGAVGSRRSVVFTDAGVVVLNPPNHILYRRYLDKQNTGTEDMLQLVRKCVANMTPDQFDNLVEQVPGALVNCGVEVARLAGVRLGELGKR